MNMQVQRALRYWSLIPAILIQSLSHGLSDTLSYSLESPGANPDFRQVSVRDGETTNRYTIDIRERINCFRFDFWVLPEGTNMLSALSVAYIAPGTNRLPQDFQGRLSLVASLRQNDIATNQIIGRSAWNFDYNPETTLTNLVEQHVGRKSLRGDDSLYFCTLIFDTAMSPPLPPGDPPTEITIYLTDGHELNIIHWPEPSGKAPTDKPQTNTKLSIAPPIRDAPVTNALIRLPSLEINLQEGFVIISSQSPLPAGCSLEETRLVTTNGVWQPTLNATPLTNGWRLPATSESKIFRLRIPANAP